LLCEVFEVHRSTYKYWRKRDKLITPETAKLHSQVKEVHRQSNVSVGARTLAIMATNNGYPLSRYRAGNNMKKLDLANCQLPKHAYKKATQEHVAIPNTLDRQFAVR
jgi:putative transposase